MTPERAASVFRELLMTPKQDLAHFARRVGLQGPSTRDLEHAQEILQTLVMAMQSAPGPNWDKVSTMWGTLVAKHGSMKPSALNKEPAWVQGPAPAKPALGDLAPGTSGYQQQQQQQQRFVPSAPIYEQPAVAPEPAKPQPPPVPIRKKKAPSDSIQESVQKYAAFCAACAASPDNVFATMVEFGISSPAMRDELDEMWNDRFDDDMALQKQWELLFHQYRQ
jgi:hypothetical protein